jgi:4-hydroxy-tetrahydrodipicolinate synthase
MSGRFGAVLTAMATPFHEGGSLDLDGAQTLARHLLDHGTDTLVVAGSTGESPTLTHDEKRELWRAVIEAARGAGKVVCGTGTYATDDTIELTGVAEELGADGALVVTPYYNKPPQRGLVVHFTKVAESSSLPLILYNIPGRTATRIEHATLLELAAVPTIVAVKDSTGDHEGVSRLVREAPPDFELYSGDDWATFSYMALGAKGIVSVASHLAGDRIREMCELIDAGDPASARKLNDELAPLFSVLFITSNPIPLKAALEMVGLPAGPPRLPLVPATGEERARIRATLEDVGVL